MSITAQPVTREQFQTRTDEIIERLKFEILNGQYRPGERLPSERDLSQRFNVSRGTVRGALKALAQLGIASIQPGGARVVPVKMATLDVLGALLDLRYPPDANLVDQSLEVFGVLMVLAAQSAVRDASDDQLREAREAAGEIIDTAADSAVQHQALRRLAYKFIEISDHLVLQLVVNGLQTQFINHPGPPRMRNGLDNPRLRVIIRSLQAGLDDRDPETVTRAMTELNQLIRAGAAHALTAGKNVTREIPK